MDKILFLHISKAFDGIDAQTRKNSLLTKKLWSGIRPAVCTMYDPKLAFIYDVAVWLGVTLHLYLYSQRTGAILKPQVMRDDDRNFDPFTNSSVDNIVPATLSIQILSGQFLTDKHGGTFVEVSGSRVDLHTIC